MALLSLLLVLITPFHPLKGYQLLKDSGQIKLLIAIAFLIVLGLLLLINFVLPPVSLVDSHLITSPLLYSAGFLMRMAILATVLSVIISKLNNRVLMLEEGFAIVSMASLPLILNSLFFHFQIDIQPYIGWISHLWFGILIAIGIRIFNHFSFIKAFLMALGIVITEQLLLVSLTGMKI